MPFLKQHLDNIEKKLKELPNDLLRAAHLYECGLYPSQSAASRAIKDNVFPNIEISHGRRFVHKQDVMKHLWARYKDCVEH